MSQDVVYNTAAVRELILQAFSEEELRVFCFDHFPVVYEQFSAAMTKTLLTHLLIEYCYRQGEMSQLLYLVREKNPYQFKKHYGSLHRRPAFYRPSKNSAVLEIRAASGVALEDLTKEQQDGLGLAIRSALASYLAIPLDKVVLLEMREGSVIFKFAIPEDSLGRLSHEAFAEFGELIGIEIEQFSLQSENISKPLEGEAEALRGQVVMLYVGNLSLDTTEEQILELFSSFGEVDSITIINNRDTGLSRGFAFVEMEKGAANKAIVALEGHLFRGRRLSVSISGKASSL